MGRRRRKEGRQSDRLEQLGFGQDTPQHGFSDQPSSGGRIGGIRGAQEFGIQGGVSGDQEMLEGAESTEGRLVEELEAASAGFAEYSAEGTQESEQAEDLDELYRAGDIEPEDLKDLIEDRLDHNLYLHADSIHIAVEPSGMVTVSGRVISEAESLRVSEILAALPGVRGIDNKLRIAPQGGL